VVHPQPQQPQVPVPLNLQQQIQPANTDLRKVEKIGMLIDRSSNPQQWSVYLKTVITTMLYSCLRKSTGLQTFTPRTLPIGDLKVCGITSAYIYADFYLLTLIVLLNFEL
jgi:hypothetical protein